MGFLDSVKDKYQGYQADRRAKAEAEEQRRQTILAGKFPAITTTLLNLPDGEKTYLILSAQRMANVDNIITHTTGKSKKKHTLGRAVVGTMILPGVGTLVGAATAGSKTDTTSTQQIQSKIQEIDKGNLILTNRRVIFMGSQTFSVPYDQIMGFQSTKNRVHILYEGMQKGEFFILSGEGAPDTELYYRAIKSHVLPAPQSSN